MKKLAIVAVCLLATVATYGQGQVNLANRDTASGLNAPIFDALGNKLDGAGYVAQLYVNGTGVGPIAEFRSGAGAGYIKTVAVDTGLAYGAEAQVQIRAWRLAAGATWDAAFASTDTDPVGNYGMSKVITMTVSGITGGVPDLPKYIPNTLESFSLVVPEPSTIALGLLGAAILFLRRRK